VVNDEKATVCRACILALVEWLVIGESVDYVPLSISEVDVAVLSEVCQDSSLLTRRSAGEGLTRLLECSVKSDDRSGVLKSLESAWSSSTLTMVLDSETTCSGKAVELFQVVVLEPILSRDDQSDERSKQSAWRILASLGGSGGLKGAPRSESEALRIALGKSIAAVSSTDFLVKIFKAIYQVAVKTLDDTTCDIFAAKTDDQRTGVECLFDAAMGYTKDQSRLYVGSSEVRSIWTFLEHPGIRCLSSSCHPGPPHIASQRCNVRCKNACKFCLSLLVSLTLP
jgi:condensin-2 complex subunit D3